MILTSKLVIKIVVDLALMVSPQSLLRKITPALISVNEASSLQAV